jgi:hypothetical protein
MSTRLARFTLIALGLTIGNHARTAPLAYGTYYDETVFVGCNSLAVCRLNFAQLPADKLLMVQKINCSMVTSSQPIGQAFFQVSTTSGGTALARQLPIALPPSQLIGPDYWTNFREDTHFLVGNGRFPFLIASANLTTWNVTCTMIGELLSPIQ